MVQIDWQQQAPDRPHETVGIASEKIAYYVYDQGDGLFLATVRVRKGLGTTNLQIRDDCKNIDEAKTVSIPAADHSCCVSCRPVSVRASDSVGAVL